MDLQITKIPLHLVDEPTNAMRSEVWDSDLDDLARSIKQFGLLQPVTLRAVCSQKDIDGNTHSHTADCRYHSQDVRYEIIAGHRRLSAHRKLGMATIDAIVREADDVTTDAMKVHENLYRSDVNPVDQAIFIAQYMERSKLSIAETAAQCNRSEEWVERRLDILTYPDYMIEAVHDGKLSMATASVLNNIINPKLKEEYCRIAALQGLSATRAKYWVDQANVGRVSSADINMQIPTDASASGEPAIIKLRCVFDGQEYPADEMQTVFAHPANIAEFRRLIASSNEAIHTENAQK